MNEPRIDPELKSLAARLAAHTPRLTAAESQELLYRCAFAAGQSAAGRSTRRWQGVAAALVLLLVAACLPIVFRQSAAPHSQPALAPAEPPSQAALAATPDIDLDAWQQPTDSTTFLEQGLQRFGQIDPALRSFAAASLSRSVVE